MYDAYFIKYTTRKSVNYITETRTITLGANVGRCSQNEATLSSEAT